MRTLGVLLLWLAAGAVVLAQSGNNVCTINSVSATPSTVCNPGSIQFSASVSHAGTVTWTLTSGNGTPATATGNSVTFTPSDGFAGTVKYKASCDQSTAEGSALVVAANELGPDYASVCPGGTREYSACPSSCSDPISWTSDGGSITPSSDTRRATFTAPANFSGEAHITASCGSWSRTVTVQCPILQGIAPETVYVCPGHALSLQATTTTAGGFPAGCPQWSANGGSSVNPGSGPNTTLSTLTSASGTITVEARLGATTKSATVLIIPALWGDWYADTVPTLRDPVATAGSAVCLGAQSTASFTYGSTAGRKKRDDLYGCRQPVTSAWSFSSTEVSWRATTQWGTEVTNGTGQSASFSAPGPGKYNVSFSVQASATDPDYSASLSGSTIVEVSLPSGSIKTINFTGDRQLYRGTNYSGGGTAINDPVWTSSGTNWPVCYTKGSAISMTVKLDVNGNLPPGQSKTLTLMADGPGSLDATTTFNVTGSNTVEETATLTTSTTLSNMVYKTAPTFSWKLICGDGTNSIGSSGPHSTYVVNATPLVSPLYHLALEKACGYANGDTNVVAKINSGIDGELIYRPSQDRPVGYETGNGSVLKAYDDGAAQCDVNAYLLQYLLGSVGVDASVVYYWGGVAATEGTYYNNPDGGICSFRCDRPAHNDAGANPRFTFHAMTDVAGTIYDPSYGLTGAPSFTEFAPADVDANPSGNFPSAEDTDWDGDENLEPAATAQHGGRADWVTDAVGNAVLYPYTP